MRIAVITSSYPSTAGDPAGHFVQTEVHELRDQGHEVTVFGPAPLMATAGVECVAVEHGGALGWPGITARLREQPARAIGVLRFVLAMRKRLRRAGDFDRVIAHWIVPCFWPISGSARSARVEVVVHGSDARLVSRLPAPVLKRWFDRACAHVSFRFVSEELRALLANRSGTQALKASVVRPASIDVSAAPQRSEARERLNLPAHTRVVVVVARLVPSKRVATAIRAALLIPDVVVHVIGDGPELSHLREAFPEVQFAGGCARERALTYVRAADLLVNASYEEGAPTSIREARALGVPVVTTPCGDVATWTAHDHELYVVRSFR